MENLTPRHLLATYTTETQLPSLLHLFLKENEVIQAEKSTLSRACLGWTLQAMQVLPPSSNDTFLRGSSLPFSVEETFFMFCNQIYSIPVKTYCEYPKCLSSASNQLPPDYTEVFFVASASANLQPRALAGHPAQSAEIYYGFSVVALLTLHMSNQGMFRGFLLTILKSS